MGSNRKKEQDSEIRQKIVREVENAKQYLKNIEKNTDSEEYLLFHNDLHSVIDEIDIFVQEVEYSESGHKYPLFSPQESASGKDLKKIKKYDHSMIDAVVALAEACHQLETAIIDDEVGLDPMVELKRIRQYVTKTRNEYRKRLDVLKGVK